MTACLSSTSIAFYDILAQACIEIKILRRKNDLRLSRLGFCIFWVLFSLFLFPLFFSFCCSVSLVMACLQLKNFKESVIEMSKFYHGVATCNGRKFAPSFSLNFLCISQASLGWALWSGNNWKDRFHPYLQKLSINDANFGQKWWRQKWNVKACHGLHRSRWVKVELENSKPKATV